MTVARMYSKALLCDTARADRSIPCCECVSCRSFELAGSNNLDFYVLDASLHQDPTDLLRNLNVVPHGPRRVIIIENFDKAPPEFADALLKSMEEGDREDGDEKATETPRSIIVLEKDLEDVRNAGQSRCEVERLSPLSIEEAQKLCARAVAHYGIGLETRDAFDNLVVGSRGLPALISAAGIEIQGSPSVTGKRIRQVLRTDWGEPILFFWLRILGGVLTESQSQRADELQRDKLAVFSRHAVSALLSVLRTGRIDTLCEPALRFVEMTVFSEVFRALDDATGLGGSTPEELLSGLGKAFFYDRFGEDLEGIEFERLLRITLQRQIRGRQP